MANSRQGGAFGFLKKSIGSVTYSTIKDGKGKRIQVARSKPTEVANPNTVAQILQRMKVKPAARFYKAFEEVLNNAFEGIAYGAASRRHFMGLAMSQTGPYIPKQATRFIPAKYSVSQGSLPAPAVYELGAVSVSDSFLVGQNALYCSLSGLAGLARNNSFGKFARDFFGGDVQVTALFVTQAADGTFETKYGRFLTSELPDTFDDTAAYIYNFGNGAGVVTYCDQVFLLAGNNIPATGVDESLNINTYTQLLSAVVAGAIIISKKDGDNWARTNTACVINEALEINLYGTEAMNAAVESYQSASGANALNSAWYLNLANGQPFMGQLTLLNTTLEFEGEGGATIQRDVTIPIGKVVNENGVLQSLIPDDASGNLIVKNNTTYGTMDDPSYGATEGAKVKVSDVYMQITGANRTYVWKEAYAIQIQA